MSLEAQWALYQAVMSRDEDKVIESLAALKDEELNFQVKLTSQTGEPHLIACVHLVAQYGMLNALNLMISKQVNLWQTDSLGQNPLHYAQGLGKADGHPEIVRVLFEAMPALCTWGTVKGVTPLHMAVYKHDTESLRLFLSAGFDLNQVVDHAGDTPLHWAARYNCMPSASFLIEKGAKASVINNKNLKPSDLCPITGAQVLESFLKQREISLFELAALMVEQHADVKPGDVPDVVLEQQQSVLRFSHSLKEQQSQNQVIIDANQREVLNKLKELRL